MDEADVRDGGFGHFWGEREVMVFTVRCTGPVCPCGGKSVGRRRLGDVFVI